MQKKWMWIGLAAALAMGGCVVQQGGGRGTPERPQVVVNAAGTKVERVDPNPLVFTKGGGAVVIQWSAPDGYTFAGNGIVVDGQRVEGRLNAKQDQITNCHVTGNGQKAQCTNARSAAGTFKYTVYLQKGSTALPPFDPEIVNKE